MERRVGGWGGRDGRVGSGKRDRGGGGMEVGGNGLNTVSDF